MRAFGLFRVCVRAEAATDRSALVDLGSLRILDAFVATVLLVCSFLVFAMGETPFGGFGELHYCIVVI